MSSGLPLLLLVLCSLSVAHSQMRLYSLRASGLPADALGISDGYVKVFCASASLGKTSIRHNEINPWWEEEFASFSAQEGDMLKLEVHDSDLIFDDLLGVCQRPMKLGTHSHECFLEKGGTLHYTYTLGQ